MTQGAIVMLRKKRIAVFAHDDKKNELVDWAKFRRCRRTSTIRRVSLGKIGGSRSLGRES